MHAFAAAKKKLAPLGNVESAAVEARAVDMDCARPCRVHYLVLVPFGPVTDPSVPIDPPSWDQKRCGFCMVERLGVHVCRRGFFGHTIKPFCSFLLSAGHGMMTRAEDWWARQRGAASVSDGAGKQHGRWDMCVRLEAASSLQPRPPRTIGSPAKLPRPECSTLPHQPLSLVGWPGPLIFLSFRLGLPWSHSGVGSGPERKRPAGHPIWCIQKATFSLLHMIMPTCVICAEGEPNSN
jgi:hypothetical protein